jgi:hypothetical protein
MICKSKAAGILDSFPGKEASPHEPVKQEEIPTVRTSKLGRQIFGSARTIAE